MRLRLPELIEEHQGWSAYTLAKELHERAGISMSTTYRIIRQKGRLANFDAQMLAALCDVLGANPGEILEMTPAKRGRRG